MTRYRPDTICCVLIFLEVIIAANGDLQNFLKLQHQPTHFQEGKSGEKDYSEYPDNDERVEDEASWKKGLQRSAESVGIQPIPGPSSINFSSALDSNIQWDKNWLPKLELGQLSAVDIDPDGNIAIFCRRSRVWGGTSFDINNNFDRSQGPINDNVVILFDKHGHKILEWGKNMFYMPHGLTIDSSGNYWLTDVAMHQIFKFDKEDIRSHVDKVQKNGKSQPYNITLKPSIELGVPFEPGNGDKNFCKPTGVAVMENGDFFVSDGYCNSRVVKFNSVGQNIMEIGRPWSSTFDKSPPVYALLVPHALALAEDFDYVFVADRENGRVLCYHAQNGSFHKEYKHSAVGTKVYSIAYAKGCLFIVNGHDGYDHFHVRGFVIDINTGDILSQFGPEEDMKGPHDIAVNDDGTEIYVVELDSHEAYRFLQVNGSKLSPRNNNSLSNHISSLLSSKPNIISLNNNFGDGSSGKSSTTIVLTLIVSAIVLIGLCVAVAAILARCQKRVRRKAYWDSERKDNFKLSSLLESRQSKGSRVFEKRPNTRDFSKLNTEPETSEDDLIEDSITI